MSEWPHLRYPGGSGNVFEQTSGYLGELLKSNEPTLVLLSGGSAIKTYGPIVDAVHAGRKNVIVGMVDERYGEVGHRDSNARSIGEEFGLWELCKENGVECRQILNGQSFEQTVVDYEAWLDGAMSRVKRSICILGIGADGHTAGMLPLPRLEFDQIFYTSRLAVGYEAPGPYPRRITVTPALLKQISHAILVGQGPDKVQALHRALELKDELNLCSVPASIIHHMPDVRVFVNEG